jgi:hypothetical protein
VALEKESGLFPNSSRKWLMGKCAFKNITQIFSFNKYALNIYFAQAPCMDIYALNISHFS